MNGSTGLDELHGLGRELEEGSITSNKFVKEVKGIS
jgi:hypothetical protein